MPSATSSHGGKTGREEEGCREKGNHNHFPFLFSPINVCKRYINADKHGRREDVGGTYMRILCRTCLGQEL